MSSRTLAARAIGRQLQTFARRSGRALARPAQRALHQILHGLISRGSPRLSETMRSLDEEVLPKKTIERLGRHLEREDLAEAAWDATLLEACRYITDESVIAVDPTDAAKPHSRELERLARVRDGSTGEIVNGFWAVAAALATPGQAGWQPLALELYAPEAKGKKSENKAILTVIGRIMEATGGRGTLAIDRGGDRRTLMEPLVDAGYDFVIRLRGDRYLTWRGKQVLARDVAAEVDCPNRVREGKREHLLGSATVLLPTRSHHPLSLVVVRTDGYEPMLLLSTLPARGRRQRRRIFDVYRARWRVEEMIRFVKQHLEWEDIRVQKWKRLKALTRLVCLAASFLASRLGAQRAGDRTLAALLAAARPIYAVPGCLLWAAAKGLRRLLMGRSPPRLLKAA